MIVAVTTRKNIFKYDIYNYLFIFQIITRTDSNKNFK